MVNEHNGVLSYYFVMQSLFTSNKGNPGKIKVATENFILNRKNQVLKHACYFNKLTSLDSEAKYRCKAARKVLYFKLFTTIYTKTCETGGINKHSQSHETIHKK